MFDSIILIYRFLSSIQATIFFFFAKNARHPSEQLSNPANTHEVMRVYLNTHIMKRFSGIQNDILHLLKFSSLRDCHPEFLCRIKMKGRILEKLCRFQYIQLRRSRIEWGSNKIQTLNSIDLMRMFSWQVVPPLIIKFYTYNQNHTIPISWAIIFIRNMSSKKRGSIIFFFIHHQYLISLQRALDSFTLYFISFGNIKKRKNAFLAILCLFQ